MISIRWAPRLPGRRPGGRRGVRAPAWQFGFGLRAGAGGMALTVGLTAIAAAGPRIERIEPDTAAPGERVAVSGAGFGGTPGTVLLSGLRITPEDWAEQAIAFRVPADGVTGPLQVRSAAGTVSEAASLTVDHPLAPDQFAPMGLAIADTGLPGAAFLVETDGTHLYGVTGFETLVTYALREDGPHALRSRFYLNQRVGDIRVRGGYLYCVGDHGLLVFRCADLQAGRWDPVAAIAGAALMGVDIGPDPAGEHGGVLLALSEYAPRHGTDLLRVLFYRFEDETLERLGVFTRTVAAGERQFAVALDPQNRKAYVSGWSSLLGADRYLLELDTGDLAAPVLNHREETGSVLISDMEARGALLWTGVAVTGGEVFRSYTLHAGEEPLEQSRSIISGFGWSRVNRLTILDDQVTVGCSWFGARPDLFLFSTYGTGTTPAATHSTVDWAFDIAGHAEKTATRDGRVFVADEWGGFLTLDYRADGGAAEFLRAPDYRQIRAGAMTEGLQVRADRIYVAGRGAGVWSVDRSDLADEAQWRSVAWDWDREKPQPHPVSGLCVRDTPEGRLIAAMGHEKTMAWGSQIIGLLYRETESGIELMAESESITVAGTMNPTIGVAWMEPDLVFMATRRDGFRAYVVDPDAPSIRWHRDCRETGFGGDVFGAANVAIGFEPYTDGEDRYLVVGSASGLLSGIPALNVFRIAYPEGAPDRGNPDAPVVVTHAVGLNCTVGRTVHRLHVSPSGLVAIATGQGVAVFHVE